MRGVVEMGMGNDEIRARPPRFIYEDDDKDNEKSTDAL